MSSGDEQAAPGVVLVVDDNAASRYVASSWLRRHDYRVIEAETGAEALGVLAAEPVDIVVLDVGLPDMSGFDVCERIKADPAMGQPVIHLSATAVRAADRVSGLSRGADAYLTEPVEPGELMATIDAVLRYYRARRDGRGAGRAAHPAGPRRPRPARRDDLRPARALARRRHGRALRVSRDGAGPRARRGRAAGRRRCRAGPGGGHRSAGADAGAAGAREASPFRHTNRRRTGRLGGRAGQRQARPARACASRSPRLRSGRSRRPCWSSSARPPPWPPTRCASTPRSTASRSRYNAASCPSAHRRSRAWTSPPATCPPPRRPRSAATSTT